MSKIGLGYGSEWQLLRFLGRHRRAWNAAVASTLARDGVREIRRIEWLDFPFSRETLTLDQEWKGVDFLLPEKEPLWRQWKTEFWPDPNAPHVDRDGIVTWDAVGRVFTDVVPDGEWLLVEAKAHESELIESKPCQAAGSGLQTITDAFEATYLAMGGEAARWGRHREAWLSIGCYQIANRLAALHFLRNVGREPARLLFVYFLKDRFEGKQCPTTVRPWKRHLVRMYESMGILFEHALKPYVHVLCLDVTNGEGHQLTVADDEPLE